MVEAQHLRAFHRRVVRQKIFSAASITRLHEAEHNPNQSSIYASRQPLPSLQFLRSISDQYKYLHLPPTSRLYLSFPSPALFAFWLRSSVVSVLFSLKAEIITTRDEVFSFIHLFANPLVDSLHCV